MDERDEAQERERRRIWTVAVRVVDGALLLMDDISLAHAALAAGVAAVLPTDVSRGVLVAAIGAAARGLSVLEPGLLSRVVHESAWPFHEKASTAQPSLELTAPASAKCS